MMLLQGDMTRRPANALAVQLAAHLVAVLSLPQLQLQRGSGEPVGGAVRHLVASSGLARTTIVASQPTMYQRLQPEHFRKLCRRHAGGVRGGGGAAGAAARAGQRSPVAARNRHPGRAAASLGALHQHCGERPTDVRCLETSSAMAPLVAVGCPCKP